MIKCVMRKILTYISRPLGLTLLFTFLFSLFWSKPVMAHPHTWIDVKSTIVFDDKGQVKAIQERWVFDELYTEFALQDYGATKNGQVDEKKLLELGKENLKNLKEYSYFTYAEAGGKRVDFADYRDVTTTLEDKNIVLNFTIPLKMRIDPKTAKFSYRIYDPSYYINMQHLREGGVAVSGAAQGCTPTVIRPKPDLALVSMAGALDKNATAPDDLGRFFAERVTLDCP